VLRVLCVDRRLRCREQFAGWARGLLGLPQGRSTIVAERIQRPDVGERHEFRATESGAIHEIV